MRVAGSRAGLVLFLVAGVGLWAPQHGEARVVGSGGGPLVIVGGRLDPDNEAVYREVLDRTLPDRPLCILPTASGEPRRSGRLTRQDFERWAGPEGPPVEVVSITTRRPERARDPEVASRLSRCGGYFFTGGDQSRIVDVLRPDGRETAALTALLEGWRAGAVVAGTSAGAAMMSDPMIGAGSSGAALAEGARLDDDGHGVWVRDGLGFLDGALVDQHFLERGRFGRLLVALASLDGDRLGLGIDENTALVVEGGTARVVGPSEVLVLSLSRGEAGESLRGRIWLLASGDVLELGARRPVWKPGGEAFAGTAPTDGVVRDVWEGTRFRDALVHLAARPDSTELALRGDSDREGPLTVGLPSEGFHARRHDRAVSGGPWWIAWPGVRQENPERETAP